MCFLFFSFIFFFSRARAVAHHNARVVVCTIRCRAGPTLYLRRDQNGNLAHVGTSENSFLVTIQRTGDVYSSPPPYRSTRCHNNLSRHSCPLLSARTRHIFHLPPASFIYLRTGLDQCQNEIVDIAWRRGQRHPSNNKICHETQRCLVPAHPTDAPPPPMPNPQTQPRPLRLGRLCLVRRRHRVGHVHDRRSLHIKRIRLVRRLGSVGCVFGHRRSWAY